MKKNSLKFYLDKIKDYQRHNKLYYEKSAPIVSDKEYDELKREILDLEKKKPQLKK